MIGDMYIHTSIASYMKFFLAENYTDDCSHANILFSCKLLLHIIYGTRHADLYNVS